MSETASSGPQGGATGAAGAAHLPRLQALTSLRFFAALYVVFFHFGRNYYHDARMWLEIPRQAGFVAVSFFFVLSGFILTYNYVDPAGRPIDRRRFWVARFARIYPIYLASQVLMLPFVLSFAPAGRRAIGGVANVLLVQSFFPQLFLEWNIPGWSLSVEAFFYLVFPALVPLLSRAAGRRLLPAMVVLWLLDLLFPAVYMLLDPDGLDVATASSAGFWLYLVYYSPVPRLPEFLLGACLGRLFLDDVRAGRRRRGWLWAGAGVGLLVPALLLHIFLPFPMLHNGLLAPLFALIILGVAHGGLGHRGLLDRVLGLGPLVLLGEASYGVYILQLPVALVLIWLTGGDVRQLMGGVSAAQFPVFVAVLVGAAVLAHRFLERPAQRFLRRRLG